MDYKIRVPYWRKGRKRYRLIPAIYISWTEEDQEILDSIRWRKFCPLSYTLHLNT